ncbi:MAG: hypothetical protein ACTHXA_13420 [Gulosibacter sp.]|uniref:hypothetical protein n=1 Tax=Gulosibacter sp. TaxID=2817531 RepID=UPI003F93EEC1
MCRPTKCKTCGKTTWAGCGQHIDAVKANVPASDWCPGNHPQSETTPASGGIFARLFGR